MPVVLWPRQEVLQLVIPQLGNVGRGLSQNIVLQTVSRLGKLQSNERKISYGNWLQVAKDVLRWNDYCCSLFWEMLTLAICYLNHDFAQTSKRDEALVDIEYVVIFLIMHVSDTASAKPSAPTVAFETIWPLNDQGEVYPSSPVAADRSPGSPVRDKGRRANSPMSSPMSPRGAPSSPRNSPQKPSSPRTSLTSTPRTPRASTQHLHLVRQKIPILLKGLYNASYAAAGDEDADVGKLGFAVGRRNADALGLVLCGGHSRDQTISPFSSLHPCYTGDSDTFSSAEAQSLVANDFVNWINLHLSMNDLLYPAQLAPMTDSDLDPAKDPKNHSQPQCNRVPLSSLSRFHPTVLSSVHHTTVVHVVTTGPSRTTSFRRQYSSSNNTSNSSITVSKSDLMVSEFDPDPLDLSPLDIVGVTADTFLDADETHSNPPVTPPRHSHSTQQSLSNEEEEKYDLSYDNKYRDYTNHTTPSMLANKLDAALPPLFISYVQYAKLYMISPYYSATITGCHDSEIVVGGVFGGVIVNGCERLKLTVSCRKLVIINCLECEFSIATRSPSVIIGDCRSLTISPFNTNYRNLKHHLRLTELSPLLSPTNATEYSGPTVANYWNVLCDVNACLSDSPLSLSQDFPSGSRGGGFDLPSPQSGTASVMPPEKFKAVAVPVKTEHALFEPCPITLPREYRQQLAQQKQQLDELKQTIASLIHTPSTAGGSEKIKGEDSDMDTKLLSSSMIGKKFMEWLVATDNVQELLDLIRIDSTSGH